MKSLQKRVRKGIISRQLASSLDLSKLSDRKANIIVTSILQSAECTRSEFNVSRSSIRWRRVKNLKAVAASLKSAFGIRINQFQNWNVERARHMR